MVDAKEGVECVDERTLCGTWAGELDWDVELWVCVYAFKNPSAGTRVGAVEPGADLVVERVGIAAVAHSKQEPRKVVDDADKAVEIARDAARGKVISDEEFVHGCAHNLERVNTAKLNPRTGEVKLFFVGFAGEQGETA